MIDLLKNYKELHNSSGYTGSVRYQIAKKKLDVLPSPFRLSSLSGSSITKIKSKNYCKNRKIMTYNQQSKSFFISLDSLHPFSIKESPSRTPVSIP